MLRWNSCRLTPFQMSLAKGRILWLPDRQESWEAGLDTSTFPKEGGLRAADICIQGATWRCTHSGKSVLARLTLSMLTLTVPFP